METVFTLLGAQFLFAFENGIAGSCLVLAPAAWKNPVKSWSLDWGGGFLGFDCSQNQILEQYLVE